MDLTFKDASKNLVKNFISNVIFIDDRAFDSEKATMKVEAMPAETPPRRKKKTTEIEGGKEVNDNMEEEKIVNKKSRPKDFNAEEVIDAFSEKGIVCSVIAPKGDIQKYKDVVLKADVVVLDWELGDTGDKSKQLIHAMLEKDKNSNPSLRLIYIYTGTKNIYDLSDQIVKVIKDNFDKTAVKKKDNGLYLIFGHTLINILKKETTGVIREDDPLKDRIISFHELPNRVISDFSELTSGLVPNAALTALKVLRENTHRLLGTFNKDLDRAFIAHRVLLPVPDDSKDHLTELIAASLKSILDYNKVGDEVDFSKIEQWLNSISFEPNPIKISEKKEIKLEGESLNEFVQKGLADSSPVKDYLLERKIPEEKWEKEVLNIEKVFHKSSNEILNYEAEHENDFSILTHHKSNFKTKDYIPKLTLGTVVKLVSAGPEDQEFNFYICIQQRCDSVRVKKNEKRRFIFLPLEEVDEGKNFHIILQNQNPNGQKYIRLKLEKSTHQLKTMKFCPKNNESIILATEVGGKFLFESVHKEKLEWLLDLKDAHAQRIANNYAAQLSRVGLDESEGLRRWSGQ